MMHLARSLLEVLFASLWQDALIGICVAALLFFAGRRLNAATRYVILQCTLLAMVAVPIATTLPNIDMSNIGQSGYGSAALHPPNNLSPTEAAGTVRRIDVVLGGEAVLALVGAWIVGVLALTLRIGLSFAQLSRLVRGSERIAYRKGVPVYASYRLAVPVALGLLRPAIIVPDALAHESADELECVLLHEMAHVRRCDAWSHTIERFIQACFFFNPAVLLILKSIAFEREAACDDWAVTHSNDMAGYTRSLAVLAVRTTAGAEMAAACGAIGFGHAIVHRIERLEDPRRNGSLILSPYALGGLTFMLICIVLSLELLAPAIAFAPVVPAPIVAAASSTCSRPAMITAPAIPPPHLRSGKAVVDVSVSASGTVTGTKVTQSSGDMQFDRAAMKVAQQSAYSPAMRNCRPVAGMYRFILRTSSGV
jgi:TonB family protein